MVQNMADIEVTTVGGDTFSVSVTEAGSSSTHEVTAVAADVERYGGGASAEELIAASFRFLLDREPKEAILSRFDLTVIERYFPEYSSRISDFL